MHYFCVTKDWYTQAPYSKHYSCFVPVKFQHFIVVDGICFLHWNNLLFFFSLEVKKYNLIGAHVFVYLWTYFSYGTIKWWTLNFKLIANMYVEHFIFLLLLFFYISSIDLLPLIIHDDRFASFLLFFLLHFSFLQRQYFFLYSSIKYCIRTILVVMVWWYTYIHACLNQFKIISLFMYVHAINKFFSYNNNWSIKWHGIKYILIASMSPSIFVHYLHFDISFISLSLFCSESLFTFFQMSILSYRYRLLPLHV